LGTPQVASERFEIASHNLDVAGSPCGDARGESSPLNFEKTPVRAF